MYHKTATIQTSWICKLLTPILIFILFDAKTVNASIINVSTISALQAAIDSAATGTIIVLADNTYSNASITIGTSGITINAATPGGVIFNGSSTCGITGSNNIFSGFQYKNGNIGTNNIMEINGNYNTIIQCNFYGYVAHNYIHFNNGSNHNQATYCNFEAKPNTMNAGPAIQISTSPTVINYTKIRYCTFMNFSGTGGDFGNEPIRIGLGVEQNNISAAVVEYCYFENTGGGDSESISVKSKGNVLRFNTQNNNPDGCFTFRSGSQNTAYSNFFINSGGIRVKEGHNHMIYNNYFQGGGSNQSSLQLENYNANPLDTIYIYHNTFYNPVAIQLGGSGAYPPTNVIFANNIFYKTSGTILSDINTNVTYLKNIFYGGASLGKTYNATEFVNINPQLTINSYSYFSLSSASPAINASNGTYPSLLDNINVNDDPYLLWDIEGQSRPTNQTQKDIGCDEYSTGAVTNHPLLSSDAGPSYLMTPTLSYDIILGKKENIEVFPNPTNGIFYVTTGTKISVIVIMNVQGEIIYTAQINSYKAEVDLSNSAKGIYFYQIKNDSGLLKSGKIILE